MSRLPGKTTSTLSSSKTADVSEDDLACLVCTEELTVFDLRFEPCTCGYRICLWCWHHIKTELNDCCPACRKPFAKDMVIKEADPELEALVKKKNKKEKSVKTKPVDRRKYFGVRVIQRNIMYVVGIPLIYAKEEILRRADFFGKFGHISNVFVSKPPANRSHFQEATTSCYITYSNIPDASDAIVFYDGVYLGGKPLHTSFGTSKYCSLFLKNQECTNPNCFYVHEPGAPEDSFLEAEISSIYSKAGPTNALNYSRTKVLPKSGRTLVIDLSANRVTVTEEGINPVSKREEAKQSKGVPAPNQVARSATDKPQTPLSDIIQITYKIKDESFPEALDTRENEFHDKSSAHKEKQRSTDERPIQDAPKKQVVSEGGSNVTHAERLPKAAHLHQLSESSRKSELSDVSPSSTPNTTAKKVTKGTKGGYISAKKQTDTHSPKTEPENIGKSLPNSEVKGIDNASASENESQKPDDTLHTQDLGISNRPTHDTERTEFNEATDSKGIPPASSNKVLESNSKDLLPEKVALSSAQGVHCGFSHELHPKFDVDVPLTSEPPLVSNENAQENKITESKDVAPPQTSNSADEPASMHNKLEAYNSLSPEPTVNSPILSINTVLPTPNYPQGQPQTFEGSAIDSFTGEQINDQQATQPTSMESAHLRPPFMTAQTNSFATQQTMPHAPYPMMAGGYTSNWFADPSSRGPMPYHPYLPQVNPTLMQTQSIPFHTTATNHAISLPITSHTTGDSAYRQFASESSRVIHAQSKDSAQGQADSVLEGVKKGLGDIFPDLEIKITNQPTQPAQFSQPAQAAQPFQSFDAFSQIQAAQFHQYQQAQLLRHLQYQYQQLLQLQQFLDVNTETSVPSTATNTPLPPYGASPGWVPGPLLSSAANIPNTSVTRQSPPGNPNLTQNESSEQKERY